MSRTRELVEEEIIRVATECFSERGYQATTIEEIAARVEISRVTFYTYFKSKEELLQTIFDRSLSAYQQGLEAILAADLPRREKLRRVVAHQVASLTADQPAIRVFFSEEKTLPPQLGQHVQEVHRKIDRLLEREIARGIDRGEIIDVDPRLLMYAFTGMCNWLYRWYRPGGAFTPEVIVETFTRILESGCLRPQTDTREFSVPEQLQRLEAQVSEMREELKKVSRHLRLKAER
ncbi:MAG: TetR/AcrR family transcriptional regulator [Deltaproteobacteria bacterium]|nr:TetR/AcrR family transcriptional regulator [Deltaproteobacteria bacterium]